MTQNDATSSCDVLVIGAGLAGIVATLELLSAGKRVTLVDRDTADNVGGLAKESFGGILVVGSDEQRRAKVHDEPALALQDWLSFGAFTAADEGSWPVRWAQTYVHDSATHIYGWLKARGIRFVPLPIWGERGETTRGSSVPRWHVVWGTGEGLMRQLVAHLQAHPQRARLSTHFGHRVQSLLHSNGRVQGCQGVIEGTQQPFELRADAVLVASGGINGSLEQVRQHWHPVWGTPPEVILNGAHQYADDTLHRAAQQVGASVTHLDRMWNYAAGVHHWKPRKPLHGLSLVPPRSALWLNWRGERFAPPLVTGFDTRDLVTRICQQERGYSWQLLNRKIALKELAVSGAEFNPSFRNSSKLGVLRDLLLGNRWLYRQMTTHCPDVVLARTLPELVDKMNALQGDSAVQLASVQAAAEQYDAHIRQGAPYTDLQLQRIAQVRQWKGDKLRTAHFVPILAGNAGPLMAVREFIVSRKSLGGIQTDLDCRVLDLAGQPIGGLYAAGEAAGFGGGGMNGLRALEGTFLGGCILTGRRAAAALVR
jgi:predicted oxidoreductase